MTGFCIHRTKGFHITLSNGWTLSVQFGGGNYCDNYDADIGKNWWPECRSGAAEIAMWKGDGPMVDIDGDTVQGYVNADTVARVIGFLLNDDIEGVRSLFKSEAAE